MNDKNEKNVGFPGNSTKSTIPPVAPHHLLPPKEEENILRRSLIEIGEDMKKMEDLITLTEDIIRRERERDREFYLRERRRKLSEYPSIPRHLFQIQKIEPREKQPSEEAEFAPAKSPSPQHEKENKSPLTLRKKITKRFKRKSVKSDKRKNSTSQEEPSTGHPLKSPTLKINNVNKSSRRLIRFSPRKYRSRLYFRNGKIGCIDAENVGTYKTNIEKTHAIVNYITSDLCYTDEMTKRASITSNIDNILSGDSSDELPDSSLFKNSSNYDYSAFESDDRGIADDGFQLSSVTDIDSFTVQPKSDDDLVILPDPDDDVIEDDIQHTVNDEEMGNNESIPNMPNSASDPVFVDFVDETTSKNLDSEEKPPHSAMSNHSNIT